jgi:hypothetical protein
VRFRTHREAVRFRTHREAVRFRTHREAVRFAAILDADGVQTALEYLAARETADGIPTLDQWAPESIGARVGARQRSAA